jgi:hypothetical protein
MSRKNAAAVSLGRKGGQSKSVAKLAAVLKNLAKARKIKLARLKTSA